MNALDAIAIDPLVVNQRWSHAAAAIGMAAAAVEPGEQPLALAEVKGVGGEGLGFRTGRAWPLASRCAIWKPALPCVKNGWLASFPASIFGASDLEYPFNSAADQ